MQKRDFSGFPPLVEDLELLHAEIHSALRRTWFAVGAVVLPCVGVILYAIGNGH